MLQVHSDSDIQLNCGSGSFKRFDSVDRDFKISLATTNFTEWNTNDDDSIPPQPLRPAPVPVTISTSPPMPTTQASSSFTQGPAVVYTSRKQFRYHKRNFIIRFCIE